jgi:ribosomal-protein-alanine N-acetyltransferase
MNKPDIEIRRMRHEDLDRVSQIENECFSDPWSRQAFADMIDSDNALYMVAVCDKKVIANCGVIVAAGEGDICNVATDSDHRNMGVAKKLLSETMKEAEESLNVTAFTLEVRAGNKAAIALYEKLGFVSEGIRPGFYSNPKEDAVIYWKR